MTKTNIRVIGKVGIHCDVKRHTSIFSLPVFYLRLGFINLCVNKVLGISSVSFYDSNYFSVLFKDTV